MAKLIREELYALVWDRPMTRLAKEFGLSDVALHKICRKHEIPTPPLGYWAKKAHGKPVTNTPLPKARGANSQYHIIIRGRRRIAGGTGFSKNRISPSPTLPELKASHHPT